MSRAENPVRIALSAAAAVSLARARGGERERCGLLFGAKRGKTWNVARVIEVRNAASGVDRFTLDPVDTVRAILEQEALGLSCLGAWHTHPESPAELSPRDRVGAQEGWCSLVLGDAGDARVWHHGPGGATRELAVVDLYAQAARIQ